MAYNEDESLDQLKTWWARWGTPVLLAVSVVLFSFAGWRYWNNSRYETAAKAQALSQQMLMAKQQLAQNADDKAASSDLQRLGHQLMDQYENTPYAVDAAWLLARRAVDENDLPEAVKMLRWALDHKTSDDAVALTHVRLARVLAAQKQYPAALAELKAADDPALAPMVDEVRGDIALQQGDRDGARKAYQAADAALAARDEARPVLELKLADVGLTPAKRKSDPVLEATP